MSHGYGFKQVGKIISVKSYFLQVLRIACSGACSVPITNGNLTKQTRITELNIDNKHLLASPTSFFQRLSISQLEVGII